MSYALLRRLSCTQLPTKIETPVDIDQLILLRNEGMIEADIPAKQQEMDCQQYVGQATVMRVTTRGHQACNGSPTSKNSCHSGRPDHCGETADEAGSIRWWTPTTTTCS